MTTWTPPTPRDVFGPPAPVVVPWSSDEWPEDDGPDELVGLDAVHLAATIARGLVNEAMETLPDLRRAEDDENRRIELHYAEGLAGQAWQQLQKLTITIEGLQKR
jgi:hypothetical protein